MLIKYTKNTYIVDGFSLQGGLILKGINCAGVGYNPIYFRKITPIKSAIKELVENYVEIQERIDVEQPVEI